MTAYLIRRVFQMVIVIFIVSIFMYFLFSIAPGGPLAGLSQQQRRITPAEMARLRAQYELDFYWPFRYTRWLIGCPNGPMTLGGNRDLANLPVGCYLEATPNGRRRLQRLCLSSRDPADPSGRQKQPRHPVR
ncbi:MAG: hypothetical protein U0X20_07620 [Caldilineaceae bacterium]